MYIQVNVLLHVSTLGSHTWSQSLSEISNKQRPNSQGLWHYGCLQGSILAHACDWTELAAAIMLKTQSLWVPILTPIKTPELKSHYQFRPFKVSAPILSMVRRCLNSNFYAQLNKIVILFCFLMMFQLYFLLTCALITLCSRCGTFVAATIIATSLPVGE